MKKTSLFLLVLALLGTMGVTGLAWAQVQSVQPIPYAPPKTVFISSQTYVGNLGGVAGADQLCQRLASAAGLSGTYKAWLSDANNGTPATRWKPSSGPFRLRNGVTVANSWTELITTGKLLKPINLDEYGKPAAPPPYSPYSPIIVWTGTIVRTQTSSPNVSWSASLRNCNQWTNAKRFPYSYLKYDAYSGNINGVQTWYTDASWANVGTVASSTTSAELSWVCDEQNYLFCDMPEGHLYCFQQ